MYVPYHLMPCHTICHVLYILPIWYATYEGFFNGKGNWSVVENKLYSPQLNNYRGNPLLTPAVSAILAHILFYVYV
jgi:hypothetical protein